MINIFHFYEVHMKDSLEVIVNYTEDTCKNQHNGFLVRCKDCIFYTLDDKIKERLLNHWCRCVHTKEDDYCSYGKRKENK